MIGNMCCGLGVVLIGLKLCGVIAISWLAICGVFFAPIVAMAVVLAVIVSIMSLYAFLIWAVFLIEERRLKVGE